MNKKNLQNKPYKRTMSTFCLFFVQMSCCFFSFPTFVNVWQVANFLVFVTQINVDVVSIFWGFLCVDVHATGGVGQSGETTPR